MKNKKKDRVEIPHKFFFPLSEDTLSVLELSEKDKPTKIQILKTGKFRHPWWGVLAFDNNFFDKMMGNFDRDIPQEEISFDFQHQPDWGASAWVKSLSLEGNDFMATVVLTDRGRESIKKKEFKYFSAEYTDNYTDYSFEEEVDEETGGIKEKEVKMSYGPALLGGGLTNRPFIKGMRPVSLSEAGEEVILEEIFDEEEVEEEMKKKMEEMEKEQKKLQDQIKKLEEKGGEDKDAKAQIEDLQKKLEDVTSDLKTLKETNTKSLEDEENRKLEKEKDKNKKLAEEKEEADKKLKKSEDNVKALTVRVDAMNESVKTLMKSNETLKETEIQNRIENRVKEIKELGVFPSTLKTVKEILKSKEAKDFSLTLSEIKEGEEKPVERTLTFADAVFEILASIPEDHRFTEAENSESLTDATGKKSLSVEDIEKYAKDNEITFDAAYIELDPNGEKV